ncbi:hypothetical protein [Dongia rigui]|uniref:CPBP family intramembrane metalloprotease n=1 Tax=Dongia rigui TaxID=940149 RepID=A0ABU5DY48_9PROT|nr:hypothetical protein [Dongia rigui]MDY0872256.1 hypothetical protein [Dongia rigui]
MAIEDTKAMNQASGRIGFYLAVSFLVALLLFHIGVQHNPEGEFIDLGTMQLDLGYSALFLIENMAVLLVLPLSIEAALAIWARWRGQRTRHAPAQRWLPRAVVISIAASLAIAAVATYAAWRHGQGTLGDAGGLLWVCAGFFLRCVAFFFAAILAAATMLHLVLAVGRRLLAR